MASEEQAAPGDIASSGDTSAAQAALPAPSRATLLDVARRAGVSGSTASLAFSGAGPVAAATRERVLTAAAELGYVGPDPRARSLRQGRSGVVGIVFDETLLTAFRDPVNVATLDGIATGLGGEGNGLLLLTETGAVGESGHSPAIDAAVLMGCTPAFDRLVDELGRRGIPTVSIEGGQPGGSHAASVDIALDNVGASVTMARHLHELGHRRVATVTLALDPERRSGLVDLEAERGITSAVTADRLAGLRRVFPDADAVASSFNLVEEGLAAGLDLLVGDERIRPTAIVAQSDLLAVGVIQAAESLGLEVPGDVSVTGFDGVRIDGLTAHDLTTMRQPAAEKGRAAGAAVVELLAGRPVASTTYYCTFHPGTTTAAPPPERKR